VYVPDIQLMCWTVARLRVMYVSGVVNSPPAPRETLQTTIRQSADYSVYYVVVFLDVT